jgi:hypothetical protein
MRLRPTSVALTLLFSEMPQLAASSFYVLPRLQARPSLPAGRGSVLPRVPSNCSTKQRILDKWQTKKSRNRKSKSRRTRNRRTRNPKTRRPKSRRPRIRKLRSKSQKNQPQRLKRRDHQNQRRKRSQFQPAEFRKRFQNSPRKTSRDCRVRKRSVRAKFGAPADLLQRNKSFQQVWTEIDRDTRFKGD